MNDATGAGRGYAVAGGVAGAIEKCIREYYPDTKMDIQHVEGLEDCRKIFVSSAIVPSSAASCIPMDASLYCDIRTDESE